MQVTGIFSTPILETILDNVNPNVLEYVINLPYEYTGDRNCEYSVSKKIHQDLFFSSIFCRVQEMANVYAAESLGFDLNNQDYRIKMKTSWAIKMKPGDFAHSHFHAQSIFTGILYLKVDDNGSNKIRFNRPVNYRPTIELNINNWNLHNCLNFFVTPVTNKLVFFPSHIHHSADVNESNETLYCLVFDFFPKGILERNSTSELILNW